MSARGFNRSPGLPGTANPRAASSGRISCTARVMVDRSTVEHRQRRMRQLEPRNDQGGDHPVGEGQLMTRSRACVAHMDTDPGGG